MNLLTGSPDPKLFKFVDRPDSVADSEVAKAQPVYISGLPTGGDSGSVAWPDITGKPAVIAAGADQAAARAAIGAGTGSSNLALGTTATTALAGNTALLAIGTTATTAAAGNHTHAATAVTATAVAGLSGTTVQAILNSIGVEIAALKAAATP